MKSGAQRRDITAQTGKRATAFEVEIETFWCNRICRLPDGRTTDVWLTPRWVLTSKHRPMSVRVGSGPYSRACELSWFRQDCFDALEGR